MFGWEPSQLQGQSASVFFEDIEEYKKFENVVSRALSANQRLNTEWLVSRKDGSKFLVSAIGKSC